MGNLVNATSTRLGWFQDWKDLWYSKPLYYGEYLYAFFRIRYYLIYLFCSKDKPKQARFYSHFILHKVLNKIIIKIHYYDSAYISFSFDIEVKFFEVLHGFMGRDRLRAYNRNKIRPVGYTIALCTVACFFRFLHFIILEL